MSEVLLFNKYFNKYFSKTLHPCKVTAHLQCVLFLWSLPGVMVEVKFEVASPLRLLNHVHGFKIRLLSYSVSKDLLIDAILFESKQSVVVWLQ